MVNILIAITTGDDVPFEVMEAIYNLNIPDGVKTDVKVIRSYSVSKGRQDLVEYALEANYDYLFFVDSDVILPQNSLIHLLSARKIVINGTYCRKEAASITSENPWTTLYRHDYSGMAKYNFGPYWLSNNELPKEGVIPVDCAGLGCTLIHMDLFRTILPKQDYFVFCKEEAEIEKGPYCLGEDMYFFRLCILNDVQPYAHGAVRCGHMGKFTFELPEGHPI
jgi:hypothetical protein